MNQTPTNNHRPDAQLTIRALTAGTFAAVTLFAASFLLGISGQVPAADVVGTLGVIVLLATPAAALLTTSFELRVPQRSAAMLALLVLVVLAAATVLALLLTR